MSNLTVKRLLSFLISPGKGTNAGCLSIVRDCVLHTVTPSRQRLYAYGLAINSSLSFGDLDEDQRISTVGHDSYLKPFPAFSKGSVPGPVYVANIIRLQGQVVRCSGSTLCTNKVRQRHQREL